MRTDSQGALRDFANNTLPTHIHGQLNTYMHQHPRLNVLLEWIPGHQGIEGNENAHALARDSSPSNPSPWPEDYDPKDERANHRKYRRQKLKELRHSRRLLPPPSPHFTRRQATYIRQAETNSLPCDLFNHKILNRQGLPYCQVCGGYPNIQHTYWSCPRATHSPHYLSPNTLPFNVPCSLESWVTPPVNLPATLWPQLLEHICFVLDRKLASSLPASAAPSCPSPNSSSTA